MFVRVVADLLLDVGVTALMYLDDWLLQSSSLVVEPVTSEAFLSLCGDLGFVFNVPMFLLGPSRVIQWLGLVLASPTSAVCLSATTREMVLAGLRRMVWARTCYLRIGSSLMGSLTFAEWVVPLGRLWCRRL